MAGTEATGGFPILTPDLVWHPEHNPEGIWAPITMTREMIDESWNYIQALGFMVLWTKHCNRFTYGSTLDPVVQAASIYHTHLRGHLEAEPMWFPKGISWRTEFFGVFGPEFPVADDPHAQSSFSILQLFDGFADQKVPPYDLVVAKGQAASHCVLRSMQQAVKHMVDSGFADSVQKIVYLMDAASIIPGFEDQTKQALDELAKQGVRMETTESFQLVA
jgi:nicotinamidase-related amidase